MFFNKLESERGELEIVYDVQWKTPGNDDDKAKIIGIVDTPDTNLDWNTFKSYLIQNSGNMRFTTDDIRISYLDSDDDLIPVDSELEFRECLKFSRIRARRGRKIVMKVNMISNGGAKPKDPTKYNEDNASKHVNPKLFCLKKKDMKDKMLSKKTFPNQSNKTSENKDGMPEWFETFMTKFKTELVDEITSTIMSNVRSSLSSGGPATSNNSAPACHSRNRNAIDLSQPGTAPTKGHHQHHHLHHVIEKRKKKKKMPEDDSSDCTDGLQLQWEERLELLRHMQKINKREKKFEKKLDAKLEKLECKTKKIMEKKHFLWNSKKNGGISAVSSTVIPASSPVPAPLPSAAGGACDLVMDATPVDEYNYVPHVLRGELVHQVWKVMNDGQLPWTDETELRFAWGSKSLVPLTTVVKCPSLKPGDTGKVKVTLQAPLFPGNFESYWHFHHQGRRFGHWLGCAVIVDPDPRPETPAYESNITQSQQQHSCGLYNLDQGPLPVDLTMKCQQTYSSGYDNKTSTTDDMKIYNIETKPESCGKIKQDSVNLKQENLVKNESKIENSVCVTNPTEQNNVTAPSAKLQTDSVSIDSSSVCLPQCVIDTELEEFPRLESYTSLTKPEIASFMSESFPDLVQRGGDDTIVMNKPDVNSWTQYLPLGITKNVDVVVADLLYNKEQLLIEDDKNVCITNDGKDASDIKYEKILNGVNDMSFQEDTVKENNDNAQTSADAGEYISGSDSDNISIISGTVSVDSDDSEPSDEFVVVPMPTCLNCDMPGESLVSNCLPVTAPISVEIPKTSSDSDISAHAVQPSDNNNNMELKPYPTMPTMYLPTLYTSENCASVYSSAEIPELSNMENKSESIVEFKEEQKLSDDENTVYVRDATGISIPVAKVIFSQNNSAETGDSSKSNEQPNIGFGVGNGIRHSTFGDPNFGQGPNGPRFPFSCGNDSPTSPPHCHNPGGPCNFRPQHDSPVCSTTYSATAGNTSFSGNEGHQNKRTNGKETFCSHFCQNETQQVHSCGSQDPFMLTMMQQQQPQKPSQCAYRAPPTYYPFDGMYQHQEMVGATSSASGTKTWTNAYHNIHTEQPRACKYTYVYNNGTKENISSSSSSGSANTNSSSSRRGHLERRETSPVVAAVQILPETLVNGAVNVASSAINTARSVIDMLRPRHDEPVVAQWEQVPPAMENSLRMLSEMGFNNRELNIMLLSQHNNDVTRVISELVQ